MWLDAGLVVELTLRENNETEKPIQAIVNNTKDITSTVTYAKVRPA